MSRTFSQLKSAGLLPMQDEDGITELSVYDVGTLAGSEGSDLSDCLAFENLCTTRRGRASKEVSLTLTASTPNSRLSESFFKAAGAEVLTAVYGGEESSKRQIMNQADYFYYSGHGLHKYGLADDYSSDVVRGFWNKDLNCAIFAGCSILDVNDYNDNFYLDPEDHQASPGELWESAGPDVLLGYNFYAPQDGTGAPAAIVSSWIVRRSVEGDVDAWMNANARREGRNACAIIRNGKYVYFKKIIKGFYVRREVLKEDW